MGTRSVEADRGITPTIAHVLPGIVHGLPPAEAGFEKVPILRRIWSQRFKRWRCRGWKRLPERHLYGELGLVRLIYLIPSLNLRC
jgi:hypothetical protein